MHLHPDVPTELGSSPQHVAQRPNHMAITPTVPTEYKFHTFKRKPYLEPITKAN